jgi:hypothetical protein
LFNKSWISSYSLFSYSLLSLTYKFIIDEDRPNLSYWDHRASETLFHLKPLKELNPLTDPIAVIKEILSLFNLGITVSKPLLCEINKYIYNDEGHTVDAYWIN